MSKRIYDRVRETSTSTGTGNFTLNGPTLNCLSFWNTAGFSSLFPYCIESPDTNQFEIGEGYMLDSTTLVRNQILQTSSNVVSVINFGAGTKFVFISNAADRMVVYDSFGSVVPISGSIQAAGNITSIGSGSHISAQTTDLNTNPYFSLLNSAGSNKGFVFWDTSTDAIYFNKDGQRNSGISIGSTGRITNFSSSVISTPPGFVSLILNTSANTSGLRNWSWTVDGAGSVFLQTMSDDLSVASTVFSITKSGGGTSIAATPGIMSISPSISVANTIQTTSGSFAPTSIYRDATHGLFIAGGTGSINDVLVSGPGGTPILRVPTQTTNLVSAGSFQVGVTSQLGWTGRSVLTSPSDGIVTLLNNAGTGFTRLQFGGTTSVSASIKPDGVGTLGLVLADDSAYGNFNAGTIHATNGLVVLAGKLTAAASTLNSASLNIIAGGNPTSPADGDLWYDGTNLKFRVGGTTKIVTLT